MVASFGRRPDPEPEKQLGITTTMQLVPVLDLAEMTKVAAQIQQIIHEAVRGGFSSAMEELAGEDCAELPAGDEVKGG